MCAYIKELQNLYYSTNVIRVMGGRDEECIKNLFGKPEGTRPLGGIIVKWILKK
jgi:hypothetical protein